MIKGLRLASIWSEDLNNLLPFYRDVIGLPVGMEAPGFVIMGDPNSAAVALGTHSEVHGPTTDPARPHRRLRHGRHQGRLRASEERRGGIRRRAEQAGRPLDRDIQGP